MITTKRPGTDDYTQVGFIEAKDNQGNYQNIDHIYDSEGNIVFQQGYLNEYDGANDFRIPAIGKPLIDYTIYGNTFQDGVPTPDNPIMPEGTGERTGNLFDEQLERGTLNENASPIGSTHQQCKDVSAYQRVRSINLIHTDGVATISFNNTQYNLFVLFFDNDALYTGRYEGWETGTFTVNSPYIGIIIKPISGNISPYADDFNIMINSGSTPLPYEPYGYKIPISSASTTTPVYLGEVETTRKIIKYEFNGSEAWAKNSASATEYRYYLAGLKEGLTRIDMLCSHLPIATSGVSPIIAGVQLFSNRTTLLINVGTDVMNAQPSGNTVAGLKKYLATQYANGTPVTVWYVLATEETGIVNEPLMRIGDYSDTLSYAQAGVEIPTLKRPNTTEIDITTSLPPSEVYAKYRGSKTQKYDLFLAANGDSFEAKNGQSLYIGDDT